jgi:hypothetical protein
LNPFNKLLLIPLVALAIGGGVGIAAATNGSAGDPATPPATDATGPCDEVEHATDPRCSDALLFPEDTQGTTTDQAEPGDDNGQDANDPGDVEDQNDDDQGQPGDDQGENEDDSGPSANSGPGSSHDSGDDSGSDDGGQSGHDGGDEGGDD